MLAWIAQNIGTLCVCIALAAIVTLIIISMAKDKKRGKSPCGGNCASCKGCAHK